MSNTVEEAKAEFTRAKDRLAKALNTTADDKANWSPCPAARTPVEVVAHAASSTVGIQGMLEGKSVDGMNPVDMDRMSREAEKEFKSKDQALAHLETTSTGYISFLDSLTPEQIASTVDTPFGSFPMAFAITFPADHIRSHAAQIDYIQTAYGDREWHF